MLLLTASDIRHALPMSEAIQVMGPAFSALSSGKANVPLRTRIDIPGRDASSFAMPAFLPGSPDMVAVKTVQVFPRNAGSGDPVIHAVVLLFDGTNGKPLACMEGSTLTAIRTGAASGLATELMARPESSILAIFGAGVQARTQIEAVCAVRPITEIRIFSLTNSRIESLIAEMRSKPGIPGRIRVAESPKDAVSGADIICTATTSSVPVFDDRDVSAGTHINAIGSYLPSMQEIPTETIKRACVVVDSREAVFSETGDIIIPQKAGRIPGDHIRAEIGEIVAGIRPGRTTSDEITLFKSVGNAVQDTAAAEKAYQQACANNIGRYINWQA